MRRLTAACILMCVAGVVTAGEWPDGMASMLAGRGARCEVTIWSGSTEEEPDWEGRTLAKEERIRVISRRVRGSLDPGPEELLWTGEGAVQFMGGRPASFEPGMVLSVMETYLLVELLVPLWAPTGAGADAQRVNIEGPFGTGFLVVDTRGKPESLVVERLRRPLFDGSLSMSARFAASEKDVPWGSVTVSSATGDPLLTVTRSRFKRSELDDELFSVESDDDITLADLSRPLGQLLGSDSGEYTETAGAQGLWDDGGRGGVAGPVYLGYRVSTAEVDRFLRDGKLGRYGHER